MSREDQFEFSIFGQTVLHIFINSTFIRVLGYGKSIGTIFEVGRIVVLRFRRHLMMIKLIFQLISSCSFSLSLRNMY